MPHQPLATFVFGILLTLAASTSTAVDGDGSCKIGGACKDDPSKHDEISSLFQSKLTANQIVASSSSRPRKQKLAEINASVNDLKGLIGAVDTPEVPGIIQALIDLIENDLQVKVKEDQTETQTELDKRLDLLTTTTNTAVDLKAGADQSDKTYDQCVTDEKQMMEAYETCKQEEADLIEEEPTDAFCGNPDFDIVYTNPPQLDETLHVTFSAGIDVVKAELDAYLKPVTDWFAATKTQAESDQKKWDYADQTCKAKRKEIEEKKVECAQKLEAWRGQHETCESAKNVLTLSLCDFGHAYQGKCAAKTSFDELVDDIEGSGTVWSEPDRENEWTQTVKLNCVLAKFKDSIDLNTAVVDDCTLSADDAAAQFTQDVTRIDKKQATYDTLTSGPNFTCSETHLTFGNGALWTVPRNDAGDVPWIPSSAGYTRATDYTYAIQSDSNQPPFDFCEPSR